MKYEGLPLKALVIWEAAALLIGFGLVRVALFLLNPYTIIWYIVLWLLGALIVLACFLYLPLLYISVKFAVTEHEVVVKRGVIFNKTHYLVRKNITYVSVYRNPLTFLIQISSLVLTAPGAQVFLLFMNHRRALQIARELSHDYKFKEL